MSNRPHPRARQRRAVTRADAPTLSRRTLLVGLGAALAVIAIVAVVISATTDDDKEVAGLQQTRPVEVTGTALAVLPESGTDPAIGATVPQLTGASFDGTAVSINNDGEPKVVLFIAHWCPHCQAEVPVITRWIGDKGEPPGVSLYAVATGTTSSRPNYPPSAWLDDERWPIVTLADSTDYKAATAFGLSAYPYFVAISGDGKLVARVTGELTTDQLDQLVAQARG